MGFPETALSEPLGCILHALDRVVRAPARYMFHPGAHGSRPIEHVLILGAGPAGLLFLQNLRREVGFEGTVLVADRVPEKLSLVKRFGGTPLDVSRSDLVTMVSDLTRGRKIDLLIEATGSGAAFRTISSLIRKQATVLLYGHGHQGTDLSVLNRLLFLEPTLVVSVGASGALNSVDRTIRDHNPGRRTDPDRTGRCPIPHHPPLSDSGDGEGRLRQRLQGRRLHQGRPGHLLIEKRPHEWRVSQSCSGTAGSMMSPTIAKVPASSNCGYSV